MSCPHDHAGPDRATEGACVTPDQQQPTDAELAGQPAAYWTGVAYEALIAYTRAQQAEKGHTQPQFWLLRNLSANDISPDGEGMTVSELQQAMASYIRPEDDLAVEAEALVERGWLTRGAGGRLWITEAGTVGLRHVRTGPHEFRRAEGGHPPEGGYAQPPSTSSRTVAAIRVSAAVRWRR